MGISQVHLVNFRNYNNFKLECDPNLNVAIFGNNGVGKTNLLESISLFAPGRGLKNSTQEECIKFGEKDFYISIDLNSNVKSNVKIISQNKKKSIKIDNKTISSFSELLSTIKVMWLTPQMNNIFSGEKNIRRKFFDRIVANFFNIHIENLIQYEYLKSERIKLLKNKIFDDIWLNNLEKLMSESGTKIAIKRLETIELLQKNIENQTSDFLKSTLVIDGHIEEMLSKTSITDVQHIFAEKLKSSRTIDTMIKKTTFGVHISDFYTIYQEKKLKSSLCSTGEQKLLLISIVLAAVQNGSILLLDDITEHIDEKNCFLLMEEIFEKKCQVWISSIYHNYIKKFCIKEKHFMSYKFNNEGCFLL